MAAIKGMAIVATIQRAVADRQTAIAEVVAPKSLTQVFMESLRFACSSLSAAASTSASRAVVVEPQRLFGQSPGLL